MRTVGIVGVCALGTGLACAQHRPAPDECAQWWGCHWAGLCHTDGPRCAAATDADCTGTTVCAEHGACRADAGYCRNPATAEIPVADDAGCRAPVPIAVSPAGGEQANAEPATTRPCQDQGRCVAREGRCRAESDADCRRSTACRVSGTCTAYAGVCIATTPADCQAAETCGTSGECTLEHGLCVATDADCRRANLCPPDGPCEATHGRCEVPFVYFQF